MQTLELLERDQQWRALRTSRASLVALLALLPARLHALAISAKTSNDSCFAAAKYHGPEYGAEQPALADGQCQTLLLCEEKCGHASALADVLPALLPHVHACTTLTGLTLHECAMSKAASTLFAPLLSCLPQLQQLRIERVEMCSGTVHVLVHAIVSALTALRELSLADNGISATGAQAFAACTPACRELEVLDLRLNDLQYAGYSSAVALCIQLPRLRVLDLRVNAHIDICDDFQKHAGHLPPLHLCSNLRAVKLPSAREETVQLLLRSLTPILPQLTMLHAECHMDEPGDDT